MGIFFSELNGPRIHELANLVDRVFNLKKIRCRQSSFYKIVQPLHFVVGEWIWEDWTHCEDETKTGITIEEDNETYYFPQTLWMFIVILSNAK